MKNKVLKITLLALVPVAMLATVGISYGLWKYSTIESSQPESNLYAVHFYTSGNTETATYNYENLEFDSAFEFPDIENLSGWCLDYDSSNGYGITIAYTAKTYKKYNQIQTNSSIHDVNFYAKYNS